MQAGATPWPVTANIPERLAASTIASTVAWRAAVVPPAPQASRSSIKGVLLLLCRFAQRRRQEAAILELVEKSRKLTPAGAHPQLACRCPRALPASFNRGEDCTFYGALQANDEVIGGRARFPACREPGHGAGASRAGLSSEEPERSTDRLATLTLRARPGRADADSDPIRPGGFAIEGSLT